MSAMKAFCSDGRWLTPTMARSFVMGWRWLRFPKMGFAMWVVTLLGEILL
jgi:hypothetical protein